MTRNFVLCVSFCQDRQLSLKGSTKIHLETLFETVQMVVNHNYILILVILFRYILLFSLEDFISLKEFWK